ncbi:unnamed protein product [Fraxinus pennsylvanica]|uniref:Uncharacterized protein n=1 Tax=Fraxinus pennsylvanica TaxID=56036 RepID=A0AAD1ZFE8_9LAMI|nr:unnamed protein product [Fraxinus pennsylvanica]
MYFHLESFCWQKQASFSVDDEVKDPVFNDENNSIRHPRISACYSNEGTSYLPTVALISNSDEEMSFILLSLIVISDKQICLCCMEQLNEVLPEGLPMGMVKKFEESSKSSLFIRQSFLDVHDNFRRAVDPSWLRGVRVLLANEMGVGKTLQGRWFHISRKFVILPQTFPGLLFSVSYVSVCQEE